MRRGLAPLALCVLVGTPAARSQAVELLEHVQVREGDRALASGSRIEPDAEITIQIDERALLAALSGPARARLSAAEEQRLRLLPEVFPMLLDLERLHLEYLRTAELDTTTSFAQSPALLAWSQRSRTAFERIDAIAPLESQDAFARELRKLVNDVLLGTGDFEAVVRAGEAEIARLHASLEQHLREGGSLSFQIRARLSGGGGAGRPVHVVGYDEHAVGEPSYVPRFQTLLDDRARAELEAAESLEELVEAAKDGTLKRELEAARDALREQLDVLQTSLRSGTLLAAVDQALAALRTSTADGAAALVGRLTRLRIALERWEGLRAPPTSASDAMALIAGELTRFLDEATAALAVLAQGLEGLPAELRSVLADAGESTAQAVEATLGALSTDTRAAQVLKRWEELRASFRRARKLSESTLALAETARSISASETLDTSLDLVTAGPRSTGDELTITFEVSRVRPGEDAPVEVARARITLRLDFEGFHSVVRGALLFADARDSISGDGSWEPVPAIGFFVHFGRESWGSLWNDVLDPGIGVTLAVLDFDDSSDVEIGVAGALTLFDDILWCGYGRNLQAEADYFYVGINPLALGGLWQSEGE